MIWHLILKASFIVACIVLVGGVLFAGYVFLRAPGPWRQRIRDNFGGGT